MSDTPEVFKVRRKRVTCRDGVNDVLLSDETTEYILKSDYDALERRLREAEEQLRIAKEDAEIHLEAANRWSERAEAAERKLQGPVGAFDDDF